MVDQPLNIAVKASFHQRLALVVLAAVCLCSLLVWPPLDTLFLYLAFIVTSLTLFSFFAFQFWSLNRWQCHLLLKQDGCGRLAENRTFSLSGRRWVMPLMCVFYVDLDTVEGDVTSQVIIIWSDMLPIEQYRHLCRILISSPEPS